MNSKYSFQYCQKIVLFSKDWNKVLLAKRTGEADYDGFYTFIGGKMEITDGSIVDGLKREKDEEIGEDAQVAIYPSVSWNIRFTKKDGSAMILPHYVARYMKGNIQLSALEYSEYAWVPTEELDSFGPKPLVANIPEVVAWALIFKETIDKDNFVVI